MIRWNSDARWVFCSSIWQVIKILSGNSSKSDSFERYKNSIWKYHLIRHFSCYSWSWIMNDACLLILIVRTWSLCKSGGGGLLQNITSNDQRQTTLKAFLQRETRPWHTQGMVAPPYNLHNQQLRGFCSSTEWSFVYLLCCRDNSRPFHLHIQWKENLVSGDSKSIRLSLLHSLFQ